MFQVHLYHSPLLSRLPYYSFLQHFKPGYNHFSKEVCYILSVSFVIHFHYDCRNINQILLFNIEEN